jgi:predicted ester cyclase
MMTGLNRHPTFVTHTQQWRINMTAHSRIRPLTISRTVLIVGCMLGTLLSPWGFRAYASPPMEDTGGSGGVAGNEDVAYRLLKEVFSGGNEAVSADLVAGTATTHTPEGDFTGAEGLNAFVASLRASFPDAAFAVNDLNATGDTAVVRWTMTGTQTGVYQGIAPTGAAVVIDGSAILRFADGLIVENWVSYDRLGLVRQIGSAKAANDMEHGGAPLPVAGVEEVPIERPQACPPCLTPE